MSENISENVIAGIIAEFEAGLRKHLFSERNYPKSVKVVTIYDTCQQELNVNFEGGYDEEIRDTGADSD